MSTASKLKMLSTADRLEFEYLQAAFAHIDVRIRHEVRRWVLAGQDPNDDYRGMYIAQTEAETLLDRSLGVSWGQWIDLPPAEADEIEAALDRATNRMEAAVRQCEVQRVTPRLLQLAHDFDLDRTALGILVLCVAPAFDTKYERLYGYMHDNVMRRRHSVRLVLDLLGALGVDKFALAPYLEADAPLLRHRLIEHVIELPPANAHWLNQTLHVDETVVTWLRGCYTHHGILEGCVKCGKMSNPRHRIASWPASLPSEQRALAGGAGSPLLAFYGGDRTQPRTSPPGRPEDRIRLSAVRKGLRCCHDRSQ